MKQIIVLVAMILLGISVAGFVMDFSGSASGLAESAEKKIDSITTSGAF